VWRKLESGTTVRLLDVWGTPNGSEVWTCGWENSGGAMILRYVKGTLQTIWDEQVPRPPFVYHGLIGTLYAPNNTTVFLSGTGDVFQQSLLNVGFVRQHPVDLVNYAYRIRGTAVNDLCVSGDFAMLWHWNGSTWHRYTELTNMNDRLYGLAVSAAMVVAVGTRYNGISRTGLVIRGRR